MQCGKKYGTHFQCIMTDYIGLKWQNAVQGVDDSCKIKRFVTVTMKFRLSTYTKSEHLLLVNYSRIMIVSCECGWSIFRDVTDVIEPIQTLIYAGQVTVDMLHGKTRH